LRRQCSLRRKCKQKALFVIPSASPIACLPASQSLSSLQSATHSVLRRRYSICSNKRASPTQSIQSKLNWRGTQRSKYFSTRCEEIAVPQSIFMPIHVLHLSRGEPVDLPAVSCRVLLKQHFAQDLEEMKGQYIWSVRWYGLIERVQLPKPTRPSLSHLHYTLRSPASTRASARTC
jgi:hypothetical protein